MWGVHTSVTPPQEPIEETHVPVNGIGETVT